MGIRSQEMAQKAHGLVLDIKNNKTKELREKYRTLALTFPTMILQSGLSQAVGFLLAKGNDEHLMLLMHLAELLHYPNEDILHREILSANLAKYQLLTRKALDASSWIKRYTQALLKQEKE